MLPVVSSIRVTATHDGQGWRARVTNGDGSVIGEAQADVIEGLDDSVRALVAAHAGRRPDDVALRIELRLHESAQARVDRIAELRRQVDDEVRAAEDELAEAGIPPGDVYALLTAEVSNQEIATHGLRRHPNAIAVRFDDRGRFATVTCRECLENDRASYATLPPDDRNTLVLHGPVMCDVCFEDRT